MEERLEKLQALFAEVSKELEAWMMEDMQTEAHPAAYSIDKAMMFLRSSHMWSQDAAAQVMHYQKKAAEMANMDKGPDLELK
jgi:hypothetical protein